MPAIISFSKSLPFLTWIIFCSLRPDSVAGVRVSGTQSSGSQRMMNVSDDITAKLRVSRCRAVLEAKLFADAGTKQGYRRQIEPDWASIYRQLKRKHVTLSILWDACPPRFGTARRSASSGSPPDCAQRIRPRGSTA